MEGPEDVEVRIGETAVFTCRAAGDPKPHIKWMRNSDELSVDGERYVVREDGALVITEITENDVGEYECMAESKMGTTVSRKARAIVTASPSIRFTEVIIRGGLSSLYCRVPEERRSNEFLQKKKFCMQKYANEEILYLICLLIYLFIQSTSVAHSRL